MHQNHWRLRWRCDLIDGGCFKTLRSGVLFLMNQKQHYTHHKAGNQTVRWILHDVTFHPELCGRGFSKIHCTMIWAFPYCFRFFFRRFLPFVGWFAMPITRGGLCSGVAQRYLPTSEDLIGCGLAAAVRGHLSHSAPGPLWRGAVQGMDR